VALRFWASVAVFHAVLVPACVLVGRRVARRVPLPARAWSTALALDACLLLLVAAVTGAAAATWAPMPEFTTLRLWCQGLFGEGVLLSAWLAVFLVRRGRLRRAAWPALAALALVAVYGQAYRREPHQLHVNRHELRLAPRGSSARRLRILHLTDIQAAVVGDHEERALRAGLAEQPDLIVLTGDYTQDWVGASTGHDAARDLRALIRRLGFAAPLGVYATEGDVGLDCGTVFSDLSVRCLVDTCARLTRADGSRISLAGLDRVTSRGQRASSTTAVASSCPPAELTLVMGHSPDFVVNLVGTRQVGLALAGHTHGGQVVLPFIGPPLTFSRLPGRFAADLNDYQGVPLHVSRGVGMERGPAPQIRFLCPPEVCVLDVWY
jgi:predicted MPP superfamily phosphohydrolase